MAIESAAQTLLHNAVACGQQHRDLRMRQRSGQRQGVCLHRARPGNEYRRDSPQWHGRYRRGLCMVGFRRRRIASMGSPLGEARGKALVARRDAVADPAQPLMLDTLGGRQDEAEIRRHQA